MNSPCFMSSSITEDPKTFIEEMKKIFEVLNVNNIERVKLATYNLKNVSWIWFNLRKEDRDEDAPPAS